MASMEMTLDKKFRQATEDIKKVKTTPTEDELLGLYALYKQAIFGDCTKPKPAIYDLKGRYKWDAWKRMKGMEQDIAKRKYIEYCEVVIKKYGYR